MRRPLRQRRSMAYDHGHAFHLAHGHAYFDDQGWGPRFSIDGLGPRRGQDESSQAERDAVLADMRRAWSMPTIREAAIAERSRVYQDAQPVAFWAFDAPEPRDKSVPEWLQLHRLGLIDHEAASAAAQREVAEFEKSIDFPHGRFRAFRRPHGWWFLSATPRDPSKLELAQLVAMHKASGDVLTPAEIKMLHGDQKALRGHSHQEDSRAWQRHLEPAERELLGLDEIDLTPAVATGAADGI